MWNCHLASFSSVLLMLIMILSIEAQRFSKSSTIKPNRNVNARKLKFPEAKQVKSSSNIPDYAEYEDYYDYYYDEEPLPSGPTRRPSSAKAQKPLRFPVEYEYYEDEPLPSGPTREPPLPSGPTRRPGQARPAPPKARNTVSPALNQFLNLPFLTTQKPKKLKATKRNQRKNVIDKLGPFHEHFIAPPKLNAGALPLAFESSLPLNRFPPFNNPVGENRGDEDMKR